MSSGASTRSRGRGAGKEDAGPDVAAGARAASGRRSVVLAIPPRGALLQSSGPFRQVCHSAFRSACSLAALVEEKAAARKHRGMNSLAHAAPSTRTLLERLAERGRNLGAATSRLLTLLDLYGAESLETAVHEVLAKDVPHVDAVQQVLERERRARGLPPGVPIALPDDPRVRGLRVRPHSLEIYDSLRSQKNGKEANDARDGDDLPF